MGRHYSDEERRIASQNLPMDEIYKIYRKAGFTRSKQSVRGWRNKHGMVSLKKSDLDNPELMPKPQPKVERKIGFRDALGCYDYVY